ALTGDTGGFKDYVAVLSDKLLICGIGLLSSLRVLVEAHLCELLSLLSCEVNISNLFHGLNKLVKYVCHNEDFFLSYAENVVVKCGGHCYLICSLLNIGGRVND